MKSIISKMLRFCFAGALSLLAFLPCAVYAQSAGINVEIPVSTELAKDSDNPAGNIRLVTAFELQPLEGAPAPKVSQVSVDGIGSGKLGPLTFEAPGNYYYLLTAKLDKGAHNEAVDEQLIVRVTVTHDSEGVLSSVVTAYRNQDEAAADQGKVNTVFDIHYQAPTPTKPNTQGTDREQPKKADTLNTGADGQFGLWILIGGSALLLEIGASKKSKAR